MNPENIIVLVTGASGRIGSVVMQRLNRRFTDVVGFDRKAPSPPPPGCTHIPVDITSDESIRDGLRILREHHGTQIAAVVHLAAYYDFLGKPSPKYDEITVEGTRRLLRGLREGGFEVEQFIFSSTMLVHKPGEPGEFLTEDWPLGPTWAYPESKVRTEALIRAERGDVPAVILRLAGVYDDVCHSPPLAHQIQRIFEGQLAGQLYSGETSHGQAYLHMDDAVDAIERAVERRAQLPPESVFLIGEPETLSYDELQHTFMRLIRGTSSETHTVPGPIAKLGAWAQGLLPGERFIKPWMIDRANDHYALDISRARDVLGWEPRHALRKSLPKMVAELQADPIGWYREHGLDPPSSLKKKPAAPVPVMAHASRGEAPAFSEGWLVHVCLMHPEVVAREPGHCPKCGMPLVPRSEGAPPAAHDTDMIVESHRNMLWPHYVNLMLGFWLLLSPFALGYMSDFAPDANQLRVMAERGLPSFDLRNLLMTWSDVLSGILVIVFSALSADAWLKSTLMISPFVAIFADVLAWFLTKRDPVYAYTVVAAGGLLGLAWGGTDADFAVSALVPAGAG